MDGNSQVLAATNHAFVCYDPAYAYELRHIMSDGLERMYGDAGGRDPNVMYYLTVYNEPIRQPAEPEDVDVEGIVRGIHRLAAAPVGSGPQVTLMASGVALPWIEQARRLLAEDWGVRASTWSVTSWVELRRQALEAERENFLDPVGRPRVPYLTARLSGEPGPFVATSDFDHLVADQIRAWVPGRYHTLGADGFGFSDTRAAARRHYLIDAHCVVVKALQALAEEGVLDRSVVAQAVRRYDLRNVHAGASGAQGGDA